MGPRPKLFLYEWLVVALFVSVLLLLGAFAFWGRVKKAPVTPYSPPSHTVEVVISGAVASPGSYTFPLKANVKELLDVASPLPEADLSGFNPRKRLCDGQHFRIPVRREIEVEVKGAVVNPGRRIILSGTRCFELADRLEFAPEADLAAFKKQKRVIVQGETVVVPEKKRTKRTLKDTKKRTKGTPRTLRTPTARRRG